MDEAIRDLVVSPFAEIVAKGKTAIDNAAETDNQPMLKAAQALVREGERALKKIEPLCKKHLDEFASNFVDALKENDEIAQYRTDLNDLLWEFDDYVEADDFDASKFSELQGQSRKAAPRILDILMRMKLEPPAPAEPSLALRSRANTFATASESTQHGAPHTEEPSSAQSKVQLNVVMGAVGGPDLGLEGTPPTAEARAPSRSDSKRSVASSIPDEIPPEPETNPWHVGQRPTVDSIPEGNEADQEAERRRRISARPDSPTVPSSEASASLALEPMSPGRLDAGVDRMMRENHDQLWRAVVDINGPPQRALPTRPSASLTSSPANTVVWRPSQNGLQASATHAAPIQPDWPVGAPQTQLNTAQLRPAIQMTSPSSSRYSQASSANDSLRGSIFSEGPNRDSVYEAASPATSTANRVSLLSMPGNSPVVTLSPTTYTPIPPTFPPPPPAAPNAQPMQPTTPVEQPGLIPVNDAIVDHGLIPVHADVHHPQLAIPPRQIDCSITAGSSFNLLKGFCEGAKEVQRGGAGVKQVKKLVYGGGAMYAAKCKSCLLELEWRQVEADRAGDPNVNYKSNGIGFRLRFLSKSHLPSKTVEDQVYACLFCVQQGRTPEESDATVFFSQQQLFAHLARHPRPLPVVSGLTVVDAPEIPPAFRNDYDLHFTEKARPNIMEGLRSVTQVLPTGVAIENAKKAHTAVRRPPGGGEALDFAIGARIVGIEYPARYNGEWCVGWADQKRAAFPAALVRIEPPPKNEVRIQASSPMCAKVRWKWNPKDKERGDWLKLDKNDTVSNITWAYPGHWCWAGTNSKGKWGIFPQSHMEPNSLREAGSSSNGGDGASVKSHERKISAGGLLSKMSIRHHSDRRPGSSAGSSSSRDTLGPASPRPSIC